jgi:ADP-ribose pyrophosphatase
MRPSDPADPSNASDGGPARGAAIDAAADVEPQPAVDADAERDPLREETLTSQLAYEGVFLQVWRDEVRCPDGHVAPREYLRHPGAVMVIPLREDGDVVLERQYRYALRRSCIEFPAGKIDPGESPLDCAQRELREETGLEAAEWVYLGGFHNAIGYCDEKIEVFVAKELSSGQAAAHPGELIEVFHAPWHELFDWIRDGTVTDVKTIVGTFWLERYLGGEWLPEVALR